MNWRREGTDGSAKEDIPGKVCVCPVCGYRMERPPAIPCYTLHCPRCEAQMVPG